METKDILIVEDDDVLREVLADKLTQEGYGARNAVDGVEALEQMRKQKPDLILLDILMPRKDGMEVLEEMQGDPELAPIPVIIISNSGQPVEIKRARELGARDFLIKAIFDPAEVLEKVRKVLQHDTLSDQSFGPTGDGESDEAVLELDDMPVKKDATHTTVPAATDSKQIGAVLIVEDDEFLRGLFIRKLSSEGLTVNGAGDSTAAFSSIAETKPAIILLDLMLPGIDGYEILSQLKGADETKDIPVIVISNLGQRAEIDRAMSLGARDFMVKSSLTLDEIVSRIIAIMKEG